MSAGWLRKLTVAGPAVFKGTISSTGTVTFTGSVSTPTVLAATSTLGLVSLTASSNVTASKGYVEAVETRTTLAQLTLKTYGVSFVDASTAGTSATRAFTLGPPPVAGIRKTIVMKENLSSTRVISIATTADHYNSTRNSWQTVTGKARLAGVPWAVSLVGTTALTWAVVSYPVASSAVTYT